jgi:hypothetical protein
MRRVWESLGANVNFHEGKNYGHMYPLDLSFPPSTNKYVMENISGSGFDDKNPYDIKPDEKWMENGYVGRFDQSLYTPDGLSVEEMEIMQWGFYYVPN